MEYKQLSREQKIMRQEVWEMYLDKYCPSYIIENEDGEEEDLGRPCDLGSVCDRCHYDFDLNLDFVRELEVRGEPLLASEVEKYKEYL